VSLLLVAAVVGQPIAVVMVPAALAAVEVGSHIKITYL
jgi:hypothetical protein